MAVLKELFLIICDMSLTATFVIFLVLLARMLLRNAPKSFAYFLWGIVGFRLICPFSFESRYSLFNWNMFKNHGSKGVQIEWSREASLGDATKNTIFQSETMQQITESTGVTIKNVGATAGSNIQNTVTNMENIWNTTEILAIIWIIGCLIFLAYQLYNYFRLKKQVELAVKMEKNVYECDTIRVPFVMGFWKARIYLPFRMKESERDYILLHERYHLKRHDHQVKIIAVLLLGVYWFNPFVWLAYHFMCKDMEMSCDEKVLKNAGREMKTSYSASLLEFAVGREMWTMGALAFGETSVKSRIKNILKFQKPRKTAIILGIIVCVSVGILGCANGMTEEGRIRNVSPGEVIPNEGVEYEYQLSEDFNSFLMYKEYYRDGELKEYEIIQGGNYEDGEGDRGGGFTAKSELLTGPDTTKVGLRVQFDKDYADFINVSEFERYGFKGAYETYYLQNRKEWDTISEEKDIIFASFYFDEGDGSADDAARFCDNIDVVHYHIVFSEKNYKELEASYAVSNMTTQLFEAKNPYIGDASANGKLLGLLNVSVLGEFTTELQTSEEPYFIRINFVNFPEDEVDFCRKMLSKAAVFLALTENAGGFEWAYPDSDGRNVKVVGYTVKEIEEMLGVDDLKYFAESEEALQELLTVYGVNVWPSWEIVLHVQGKFQAPDGTLYSYSQYVIGNTSDKDKGKIYKVLSNEDNVTMEEVEAALKSDGKGENIYVLNTHSKEE